MNADVRDLVERLRAMNHAQCDDAAATLEAQASYIDDVTAEHEAAAKQLMREVEIARDMSEINYRKWAEERVRAEVQVEEIKRLRQENVGASALEALGLPSGAFRDVVLVMKERAEAAERERDALKAENERMRTLVDASTITAVSGMLVENDRIRKAYAIIECAVMELMPYYGDDYRRFIDKKMAAARAALHPTQGGE
ncbi:hypothetical protein [Xanthobacter sp. ZOL 2024]